LLNTLNKICLRLSLIDTYLLFLFTIPLIDQLLNYYSVIIRMQIHIRQN